MTALVLSLWYLLMLPPESERVVRVAPVQFLEPNLTYNFQLPITIKVRSNSVAHVDNVQIRIFPKRTRDSALQGAAAITASGCRILPSRVDSYSPDFEHPHIKLNSIPAEDLQCVNGYLATTDYILVVESSDNVDERFLRIKPTEVHRYFRYAYSFRVKPAAQQACGWRAAGVPRPIQSRPGTRRTYTAESRNIAEHDVPQKCITKVQ